MSADKHCEADAAPNQALPAGASSIEPERYKLEVAAVLRDENALAGAHDIEIRNGLAFIAGKGFTSRAVPSSGVYPYQKGKGGSLAIVDIRQPAAPKLIWHSSRPLDYEDAETVLPLGDDRLLVGTRDLFLFDTTNPANPRQIAAVKDRPRVDTINGFARLGHSIFAANKQGYIFAVDVSSPDAIQVLGVRETRTTDRLDRPHAAAFSGEFLVVVSPEGFGATGRPGKLAVYRVHDPLTGQPLPDSQWNLMGQLEHLRLAGANRVVTSGKYAYVGSSLTFNADRTAVLRPDVAVIDLGDPAVPRLRGSLDHPQNGSNGLELAGNVVFAAGGQTVQAIDVSNPDSLRELTHITSAETFSGGQDDVHDLVYHDGHLFVTAQNTHALVTLKVSEAIRKFIEAK